ncbi:DedA family protein [Streptomyces sp. URMC 127]|uniref:DedA family protein n=1 Tax=Streptomyces sp. URMC 127 TaxID=3423402 RepID=UPI003F1B3194
MDTLTSFVDGLDGWVPYAVFACVGAAAFIFPIGLVLPAELFLAVAGILAANGQLSAPLVFVVVCAAAALSLSLSYRSGQPVHRRIQRRPPHSKLRAGAEKGEALMRRRGALAMVAVCWVALLRPIVPLLMGSARYSFPRFLAAGLLGTALWAAALIGGGYALGPAITQYTGIAMAVVIVVPVGNVLIKRLKAKRRAQDGTAPSL